MTPDFWYTPGPAQWPLRPLSWIYGAGRAAHVAVTCPRPAPLPTICVGNIVAGGGGKTPVVQALAALMSDRAPWVILRGYGGRIPGPHRVTPNDTAPQVGDEALLHAATTPTVIAHHRYQGLAWIKDQGGSLAIMDDGLQNRTVRATVNLLVIDGAVGLGNGTLLPAGPLREPLAVALRRTDAIIWIGDDSTNLRHQIPGHMPVFTARIMPDFSALHHNDRLAAFAGLARPQKFFDMLSAHGFPPVVTRAFPDHYAYGALDANALQSWAAAHQARLVTTAKDAVKLSIPVATVPMTYSFNEPERLRGWLDESLSVHYRGMKK